MSYLASLTTMFLTSAPTYALAPMYSPEVQSAVICIRVHGLDTALGRSEFVRDMEALTELAAALSAAWGSADDEKRVRLLEMLPVLNDVGKMSEDFEALDAILNKIAPLSGEEAALLLRLERICGYADMMDLNASLNN